MKLVDQSTWSQSKAQKGEQLVEEIFSLATLARAAGFQTTEYILCLAASELLKDIAAESKNNPPRNTT